MSDERVITLAELKQAYSDVAELRRQFRAENKALRAELAAAQAKLEAMPTPAMIRAAAKSLRSSLWSRNSWETMAENALAAAFAEAREAR